MKILELFCGTKSISNAFTKQGFSCVTLDHDKQFSPDILVDIMEWEYDDWDRGQFNVIWASPPCDTFSVASIGTHWHKDSDGTIKPQTEKAIRGISMVVRTMEIIRYLKPRFWFIENPRGMLRKMPIFHGQFDGARETVTYCQYGDTRMKPTDIWGIFPKEFPIMACKNGSPCHLPAPRGSKAGTQGLKDAVEKGRIPDFFCYLLAKHIGDEIKSKSK